VKDDPPIFYNKIHTSISNKAVTFQSATRNTRSFSLLNHSS